MIKPSVTQILEIPSHNFLDSEKKKKMKKKTSSLSKSTFLIRNIREKKERDIKIKK